MIEARASGLFYDRERFFLHTRFAKPAAASEGFGVSVGVGLLGTLSDCLQ